MSRIEEVLDTWERNLCKNISVGGLLSRSSVAHKWKAPYRMLVLRECVFWRVQDLLKQSHILFEADHVLGSRILVRGALETTAVLIYLNQLAEKVLAGNLNFHEFDGVTAKLLLGSRDGTGRYNAINTLTVLKHCERRYPGLGRMYDALSESAHPNWEGMCLGYSQPDQENFETNFTNNWHQLYADKHKSLMLLAMQVFEFEYTDVSAGVFKRLESWIEENDALLKKAKAGHSLEFPLY